MTRQEFGGAYQKGFQRTVRSLQRSRVTEDQAAEVAQAAWVKGLERLGQLRDDRLVSEWVNAIAWNEFRSTRRRRPLMDLMQMKDEPAVEPSISPMIIAVRQALAKCTPRHQCLLADFYWKDHSCFEIAAQTGRSPEAVHAELFRAREELREHMQVTRRKVPRPESVLPMKAKKEVAARSEGASAA